MKLALIADLHGNYTATLALEKALSAIDDIDKLICLGDIVGKGPSSHLTFDWAFKHCDNIIAGNWDIGLSSKRYPNDGFYWKQIGEERLQKLAMLPLEYRFEYAGVRIRCIHGRPIMPKLLPSDSPNEEFEKLFTADGKNFNILVYADSHRQLLRTTSCGHVINTGSVGNALGIARLSFAILDIADDGSYTVSFHSAPYDKQSAAMETDAYPDMPFKEEYLQELFIGRYARKHSSKSRSIL